MMLLDDFFQGSIQPGKHFNGQQVFIFDGNFSLPAIGAADRRHLHASRQS